MTPITPFGLFSVYGDNYKRRTPATQFLIRWHEKQHVNGNRDEVDVRVKVNNEVMEMLRRNAYTDEAGNYNQLTKEEIAELHIILEQNREYFRKKSLSKWRVLKRHLVYINENNKMYYSC